MMHYCDPPRPRVVPFRPRGFRVIDIEPPRAPAPRLAIPFLLVVGFLVWLLLGGLDVALRTLSRL
jgi:hypothetical protein